MEQMRIDLNCPAEVVRTELYREKEGSWVRLILMDLADRSIDSCEATVRILDREGKETGRTVHRARALKGRPHTTFPMNVPVELPENAVSAEATLDKIWFEDRDVWRRSRDREKEYEPNLLPPGNELNALRYVAGNGAAGFPSQQAEMWICVCGRPNGNESALCARCRRQRDLIFRQYNRNAVLRQVSQRERQLDLQTRGAREEAARLQRIREEEYDRKQERHRRRRNLLIGWICAMALAAGIYWGLEPALRLWSADTALREDRLEDAREILSGLEGFPGAEARSEETEIRIARRDGAAAAADAGAFSVDSMAETAARLREKGSPETDGALADRVDLSRARAMMEAGDLTGAEELAESLPEALEGRAALLEECRYARGEKALAEKDYARAEEIFLSLGDYPGAAEKAREAVYEPALVQMEEGNYESAIQAFSSIPDYQDSRELISRCWYLKGYVLENQGMAEEARQAYLSAGEYEDAAERARTIRWNQAEAALEAEDYAAALPLYREMDGYADARDKWILCATELARVSYKQREYAQAAAWLEDLPEDTKSTIQIRTRALYLGAKAAANRGELPEAIEMMERVADYGDAARNIRNWRISLAQQKMDGGSYAEAREILEPVAENYTAQQLLKKIEEAEAAGAEAPAEP